MMTMSWNVACPWCQLLDKTKKNNCECINPMSEESLLHAVNNTLAELPDQLIEHTNEMSQHSHDPDVKDLLLL